MKIGDNRFNGKRGLGSIAERTLLLLIEIYNDEHIFKYYKNWVELADSFDA